MKIQHDLPSQFSDINPLHTPIYLFYREQLQRYRRAVQRLQPGATVRCAFITGEGSVLEID